MRPQKLESDLVPHQKSLNSFSDNGLPLPEAELFRSTPASPSQSSSDTDPIAADHRTRFRNSFNVSPEPHISSQFYTFNEESHRLMIRCISEHRFATPFEIRTATPCAILSSWRAVWRDRNEDTAYLTGWKRIQEKLMVHVDQESEKEMLYFKNNCKQCVSHVNQWQDIIMKVHEDADLKHLGLKETIERIKQAWTVGAKFYGIPESYIRVCVSSCPVCSSEACTSRNKRRRFEYTESFDVPAKEVPHRLQQLALKHQVVLCIRQKYIRYKPFMAEVKDYACHRAGDPVLKKTRILKREPYSSKRCGCGFRIRAIVPIANYNEQDKTFVYKDEGVAVFKLYTVHSGHKPGPLDGNARIMHRIVGHKGGFAMDQDAIYGVHDCFENEGTCFSGKEEDDSHSSSVLHRVEELKTEVALLEGRLRKAPKESIEVVNHELFDLINRVKNIEKQTTRSVSFVLSKPSPRDVSFEETCLPRWSDNLCERNYDTENEIRLLEDDEDGFDQALVDAVKWGRVRTKCRSVDDIGCKPYKHEKWLELDGFDENDIIECKKDIRPSRTGKKCDDVMADSGFIQDDFYIENRKWYDSPYVLDENTDCVDERFIHEGVV